MKSLRLWQDLPISINDSDFAIRRGFYFHETFRENKVLAKISEFTVLSNVSIHVEENIEQASISKLTINF